MTYVRKEPCPECRKIGRDRSGDNFARYAHGGGVCYACGYREKADKTPYQMEPLKQWYPPEDETDVLPPQNYLWLRQYLTDEEIEGFFTYSPSYERHIFHYRPGEPDYYWEGRSVYKEGLTICKACHGSGESSAGTQCHPCKGTGFVKVSKVLSHGQKPDKFWLGPWKETGVLIYVEDIVSAIKVSRFWGACPLFGSHFPAIRSKQANDERVKCVIFWLDPDKRMEAMRYAKIQSHFKPSGVIFSDKDPKACTDQYIREEVSEVVNSVVKLPQLTTTT